MRRTLAIAAVLMTLTPIAACAAGDDATDSAVPQTTVSAPAEPEGRTVLHDQGETVVPADPERVVVLDSPILDAALFLGETPVGAVRTAEDEDLPEYLGDRAEDIEIVGEIANPNLEAIAAQDPDLIISATLRDAELYDELSEIAPTVFIAGPGSTWRSDFRIVAEALGETEQAEDALADFDADAERLGQEISADDKTASIVRFLADQTRVYGPESFSGSVLAQIGFRAPELDYDEYAIAYLSPEQIEMADADVLFTTTYGPQEESTRGAVTEVWGSLRAVETGCQFDVADDTWMVGIGLIGAQAILDDVERLLESRDCG